MPTLEWIGKDKVINHHLEVPFRVLERKYSYDAKGQHAEDNGSENMIIKGDNLEALKALLPRYEGKVKCIYIDPPYNTGNEGWVYNDNVNDPKIKKWLGEVVGKEGEDLSRHDKWLCMMYPRLRLLQKLLSVDGIILISIDENEHRFLELLMDEIFGARNRISTFVWQSNYGGGAKSKHVVNLHENILFFAKNIDMVGAIELPPDKKILKYYKFKDDKYAVRGPYRLQPLATTSMDDRPNLRFPIVYKGEEIWPEKQWYWEQRRVATALQNDLLVFSRKGSNWTVNYKQYLCDENGEERKSKPYSLITEIYTQAGTKEVKDIFGSGKAFNFPKPSELILYLISMICKDHDIVLDSFAGSGTSAQAVLNFNKINHANLKFILVEMEDYAENITAERVRRVVNGYGEGKNAVVGTGGDFSFYELGKPLLIGDNLNEEVGIDKIREYIWFTETKQPFAEPQTPDNAAFLGTFAETAYYFHYEREQATTLDHDFLGTIQNRCPGYVIYADLNALSAEELKQFGIIFKKIPRDIAKL